MIKVSVKKQSGYPVSSRKIKEHLKSILSSKGIVSDAEVSVVFVGKAKMLEVGKKYLKDKNLHNVLSFTEEEVPSGFVFPPDGIIRLGEIIVCFPLAVEEAGRENKTIEERVLELVEHGAMHLMGVHHE